MIYEAMNMTRSGRVYIFYLTNVYAFLSYIILPYFTTPCCTVNIVGKVCSDAASPVFRLLYSRAKRNYSGY
jgi:hypothetical protein